MPASGDDLPQSEDRLSPSPPLALTVNSSEEEDEEEIAADAGYQPLPVAEPDDDSDIAGDSETEAGNAAESSSTATEALCSSAASNIVLHSSHLPLVHNSCQAYLIIYSLIPTFIELRHWLLVLDNWRVSITVQHHFPFEIFLQYNFASNICHQ